MSSRQIQARAREIVLAAGMAGGIDEVERLARLGWPDSRPLDDDSVELRHAIQECAEIEAGYRA